MRCPSPHPKKFLSPDFGRVVFLGGGAFWGVFIEVFISRERENVSPPRKLLGSMRKATIVKIRAPADSRFRIYSNKQTYAGFSAPQTRTKVLLRKKYWGKRRSSEQFLESEKKREILANMPLFA